MQKYERERIIGALKTLEESVAVLTIFTKEGKNYNPHMDYNEEYHGLRDSMILRFKYCVDLFWKYIKKDLEVKHLAPEIKTPAEVIKKGCAAGMIAEKDAEVILAMIKDRNTTSHMYLEEIAEGLAKKIPAYYQLMADVIKRLQP